MSTQSYKFGDGLLLLGSAPLDVSAQMTAVSVQASENVSTIDAIPVLDNTEIPEESAETYDYTLSGTFLQDLAVAGVIEWSWNEKGTEQDFIFVPHNPALRGVSGVVKPIPLKIGGDVTKPKNRPTSDFEWRIVGEPVFGVFDPAGAGHSDDVVTEDA